MSDAAAPDAVGPAILDEARAAAALPTRDPRGHKGTFGRLLVVAGSLDLAGADESQSWRFDAARSGGTHIDWRAGGSGSLTHTTTEGRVPSAGGDLGGVAGDSAFDVDARDWYAGTYLEATTGVGLVLVTAGSRVDRFGKAQTTTVDPRINVRIGLGRMRAIRYATGIYHQAPASSYYDSVRGAARLRPMRAIHHIVGYEAGREAEGLFLRVEGYAKQYSALPLEDAVVGFSSDGYGWSRGVDVFVQRRTSRLDVRGTASWLAARRRWTPARGPARTSRAAPAPARDRPA